ncbi:MAG TPA: hypothetical protein VFQ65_05300, partial [Kofleriaceae bacterium]|nr:hypothetical protein [Kofleriaceae bacterium]
MRVRAAITSSAAALLVVVCVGLAAAAPTAPNDEVTAMERNAHADAAALYAAGRTCEDTLADPVRALALYDRLLREYPDASVALGAEHHAARLRAQLAGGHTR